jgi:hypothetical protein
MNRPGRGSSCPGALGIELFFQNGFNSGNLRPKPLCAPLLSVTLRRFASAAAPFFPPPAMTMVPVKNPTAKKACT